MERSLNMQLPRGWYQVAGVEPATFRRHGLATASGNLQLSFHPPAEKEIGCGEEAMELLKAALAEHRLPTGTSIGTGHEPCAAGFMAFAAFKQIHGQCEYWLIPNDEANVFAKWQAGSTSTAGMERHDIHEMLRALHFEDAGGGAEEAGEAYAEGETSAEEEGYAEEEFVAEQEPGEWMAEPGAAA